MPEITSPSTPFSCLRKLRQETRYLPNLTGNVNNVAYDFIHACAFWCAQIWKILHNRDVVNLRA